MNGYSWEDKLAIHAMRAERRPARAWRRSQRHPGVNRLAFLLLARALAYWLLTH